MVNDIDVLVIGAGPAGLATAIELHKTLSSDGRAASIVVIDKAPKIGYHSLSGAVFEHGCLDELLPGWREDGTEFSRTVQAQVVQRDSIHYLTRRRSLRVPGLLLPKGMKHGGDCTVSVSVLAQWLAAKASAMGVEVYAGFSADKLLIEDGRVCGVTLLELGVDREGRRRANYLPAETLRAKVVVLADGSFGPLSTQAIKELNLAGKNPQVYSLGVKQLIKLPKGNRFGPNRVLHTIGYPNRWDVFGGGFLYDMGQEVLSLGLVIGLDWRYHDLNPQQELELLKSHPYIASLIEGGEVIAAGAKTIPEGGFYSMPKLHAPGLLIVGDAAGLVNMKKLKGIHLAVRSGIAAGQTIAQCLQTGDFSSSALADYPRRLEELGVTGEMRTARNMRQGFATPLGLFLGGPLSMMQHLMPLRFRIGHDRAKLRKASIHRRYQADMDRKTFVGLSGTIHEEDLRSHIRIINPAVCKQCIDELGGPCVCFCPGEVYASCQENDEDSITISPADCMHCKTCAIKCPRNNIEWETPEGGYGPKFRKM